MSTYQHRVSIHSVKLQVGTNIQVIAFAFCRIHTAKAEKKMVTYHVNIFFPNFFIYISSKDKYCCYREVMFLFSFTGLNDKKSPSEQPD